MNNKPKRCHVYTNLPSEKILLYDGIERGKAILWVDRLLECVAGFNLMNVLNDLQTDDEGEVVFESKYDIPLRIVNLVLAKYRITLEEQK